VSEGSGAMLRSNFFIMNLTVGWHVLYVKSRFERKVDQALKDISLESFLPQVESIRQWSDRKKTILKPLFPSYIFVNINSSLEFQKALSVNGACAYIRFGKEYARISEKEINQIKFLVGDENVTDLVMDTELPKVGDKKRIRYGPFTGLECEILKVGNVNKLIVQIDLLQKSITATIPSHYFEEIKRSHKV